MHNHSIITQILINQTEVFCQFKLFSKAESLNFNLNKKENNEASETRVPPASFKYDIEFNVWTKPDCEDTEVGPNPNRLLYY